MSDNTNPKLPDGILLSGPYDSRAREVFLGPELSVVEWIEARHPGFDWRSDAPRPELPPVYVLKNGWAELAAANILEGLGGRSSIGNALDCLDEDIRAEIAEDIRLSIVDACRRAA